MLKKYLPYILCFILAGTSFYFYNKAEAAIATAIATKVRNGILATALADEVKRSAYYSKENDKLIKANGVIMDDIDMVTADSFAKQRDLKRAQEEIKRLKTCAEREIALNFELDRCRGSLESTTNGYIVQIENLELNHNARIALKDREIGELVVEVEKYVSLYSDTAYKYVKIKAERHRQAKVIAAIGIVAGFVLSRVLGH